jgi:hypothetical protein
LAVKFYSAGVVAHDRKIGPLICGKLRNTTKPFEAQSKENFVDVLDQVFDDHVVQLHLGYDRFRAPLLSDAVNLPEVRRGASF